jgi:thioredoxin:protein disulfide reductase
LIVGPCVAAPLAGALLYISRTGDVLLGGSALFALAWGMGVPLLAVGGSAGALLPRTGSWMESVKRLFGMLLLATAWWMLAPVLPGWTQMLGWAFLAVVSAVMLRAFDALPAEAGVGRMFAKGLGLLLALAGVVWLVGAASGGRDVLQPLSQLSASARMGAAASAAAQGGAAQPAFVAVHSAAELDAALARSDKPAMLDFYADWCVSCREMERYTFGDAAVAARMGRMLLLRADVTGNTADDRALLKRFRLFGPPGTVFFAPGGRELATRVIGYQDAGRFVAALDTALESR